jgi:HAD superfamily hydrolase (TIGR01509 family)
MPTTLFFDLDDTLYTLDRHRRYHLARAWAEWLTTIAPDQQTQVLNAAVAERIFFRDMEAFLERWGVDDAVLRQRLYAHSRETWFRDLHFDDGVPTVLDELKKHFRLALITNGPSWTQRAKIDQLGLAHWFDVMQVSEEFGVEKPHPDIFLDVMRRCGVPASACVMIGDNPDADVRGAHACGMRAVWIRTGVFAYAADIAPPWLTITHVTQLSDYKEVLCTDTIPWPNPSLTSR